MDAPHWLLDFAENTHTQNGEDGVISKALSVLPERNKVCVEFGAWDGLYLSNVRRLIEEDDYSAIMIEGSESKYNELVNNYSDNSRVTPVHAFVGFDADTGLDNILGPLSVPKDFDFLSIDIDGNDYHVWNAVSSYRPKLVCIEFNATIPTELDFVQPADPNTTQGCSLQALCRLAKEKNYELISVVKFNALFVEASYFPLFNISDNSPQVMRRDIEEVTWLFTGYDGSVHLRGYQRLPWHNLDILERDLKTLPAIFRGYPADFGPIKSFFFRLYRSWRKRWYR